MQFWLQLTICVPYAPLEYLLGGTAAVVILALVADGIRIGFDRDPDIYLTAFRQQIHFKYSSRQDRLYSKFWLSVMSISLPTTTDH